MFQHITNVQLLLVSVFAYRGGIAIKKFSHARIAELNFLFAAGEVD
jgi:hypothetical protein